MQQVEAPAKLTIRFQVVSRRADGYHEVKAEMVSLSFVDVLTIRSTTGPSAVVMVPDPHLGAVGRYEVDVDSSNSVLKALDFLEVSAHVVVRKRIPQGAGLGGGSSDAAAVLRHFGYHGGLGEVARLGADVPPSLIGGHVRVGGIGDQVEPLPEIDRQYVLFLPEFSISTSAVYQVFDLVGSDGGDNDLFLAASQVEPRLGKLRDELQARFRRTVSLAGSGSTLFIEGSFSELGLVPERGDSQAEAAILSTAVGEVIALGCHTWPRVRS
ncbi:4-(cytidine 5'-diphospho)-2-C-methyl-D-erythritol kinase [Ferrimicrobium sp.]|uniref:4-(cytidine 5'-diphospho)-2-C-methyl-D-erythritol kinase n=1 Tax=Ferrimicrobium sp. TaxID=2926050 RepID=UPI0026351812|nr:4-(cytidine 5'-diphospho)-2-C-methyl-D-erythritol kinase [Ferrimicrobium sp.]